MFVNVSWDREQIWEKDFTNEKWHEMQDEKWH